MKKNLLVIMSQEGSPQKEFIDGLKSELLQTEYQLKILNTLGPNKSRMEELAEYGLSAGFDGIIAFGFMAASTVKEKAEQMGSCIPIFFSGIGNPVEMGLIPSLDTGSLIGVGLETGMQSPLTANFLPVQFLLQLKPNAQNILLPYHPTARNGRLEHLAKELQRYFDQRKVKVHLLPVETVDQAVPLIKEQLSKVDSLMFIYGDTISEAYGSVVDDCEKQNVTIFANGKEALEKGAVFALRSDMKFAGVKLAESIKECLEHGKKPSEIPFKLIDSNIRLAVNPAAAQAQGVVLAPEILTAYDGKGYYEELPTYDIGIMMPETLVHADIITGLYDAVKRESSIVCNRHTRYYSPYDGEKTKQAIIAQTKYLLEEVKCDILITADQFIDEVIETRDELDFGYIPVINIIDGDLDPERYHRYKEMITGAPTRRERRHRYQEIPHTSFREKYKVYSLILPPKNPLTTLEALQVIPDHGVKKVLLPLYGDKHDKALQNKVAALEAYGKEHGLSFTPIIKPDIADIEAYAIPDIKNHDAVLTLESWSNQQFVEKLFTACLFDKTVLLGTDVEEGFRRAAIAHGYDTRSLGNLLFTVTKKMIYNQVPLKEIYDRVYSDVTLTVVNQAACAVHNLTLPSGLDVLFGNLLCVRTDENGPLLEVTDSNRADIPDFYI